MLKGVGTWERSWGGGGGEKSRIFSEFKIERTRRSAEFSRRIESLGATDGSAGAIFSRPRHSRGRISADEGETKGGPQ